MAKVTAPMLSFGGSGSVANAIVFSKWKGRSYVRQKVTPANPKSAGQTTTRNLFALGNAMWKVAPTEFVAPWDLFATGQVLTGRNAFLSSFVKNVRAETDFEAMIFSPGAKGGLPPVSATATAGDDSFTVAVVAPALPTGWSITQAVGAALVNGDPTSLTAAAIVAATDASDPYELSFTGLEDTTEYHAGAWFEFVKANGNTAYGASLQFQVTTT